MLKIKLYLFAAGLCLFSAFAAAAQSGDTQFKGSLNYKNRIEMSLRRDGATLSGNYFYAISGAANRLQLKGKIAPDGKFTMQEFDAAGKQTGAFSGSWKEDPNDPGAIIEGTWRKTGGKEDLAFYVFEQAVRFSDRRQIMTRETREAFKTKRVEMSGEYPEIVGAAGAGVVGFNNAAKKLVMETLAEFKKSMFAQTAEDVKMLPQTMSFSDDIGYNVAYADDNFISVDFSSSTFTGGAHGNNETMTLNYDLKNNREIKLAELFKPGSKYLEQIAAYAKRDLQSRKDPESGGNRGYAQEIFEEGANPTADNYAAWNFTRKGLMFTFDQYQVASYADGPQTVIVPYSKLKDIAKADGALAKMMK